MIWSIIEKICALSSRSCGTILVLSISLRVLRNCLLIGKIQTKKVTITATTCLLLFKVALENSTMVAKTLILKIKQWCIEIDLHQHLFRLLYDM